MFTAISQKITLPHFGFDSTKNLRLMYGIRVLRDLINKLVYFFIPLYLYNLGPALWDQIQDFSNISLQLNNFQIGILTISFFYAFIRLVVLVTAIPLGKIVRKWGHGKSFIAAQILYALEMWALFQSTKFLPLIILAALIDGIQTNLYWSNFKTLVCENTDNRKLGKDLGLLQFLLQLIAAISPALGGFLILIAGYEDLFLVGIILNLVGIILAIFMDDQKIKAGPTWKEFKNWLQEKRFRRLGASFAGRYLNDVIIGLWPLYVFLILGSVDKVGYLYSFSLFLAMIMTFFIGSWIDKSKNRKPYFASGGLLSMIWVMRTFAFDIWSIAIVDTLERLTSNFHWLFYDAILMKRGNGRKAFPYFVYQEMVIGAAALFFWLIIAAVFLIWGNWYAIFVLGAIGVLLTLTMEDKPI